MAERVRIIEHRGVRVVYADYGGLSDLREIEAVLTAANALIRKEPHPVPVLSNFKDVPFSLEGVRLLQQSVMANKAYVRARAVVGLSEMAHQSFRAVMRASARPGEAFQDVQSALDWLVEQ